MGRKVTPEVARKIKAADKRGLSTREIADVVGVSKSTVAGYLKSLKDASGGADGSGARSGALNAAEAPERGGDVAPAGPRRPRVPAEPLTRDGLLEILGGQIRGLQAEIDALEAVGQTAETLPLRRLLAPMLPIAARVVGREDDEDADVVRVSAGDMDAAAERARAALGDLLTRVQTERAGWPRCERCGQPVKPADPTVEGSG